MEREKIHAKLVNNFDRQFEVKEVGTYFDVTWIGEPTEDDVKAFLRREFPEVIFNLNRED